MEGVVEEVVEEEDGVDEKIEEDVVATVFAC